MIDGLIHFIVYDMSSNRYIGEYNCLCIPNSGELIELLDKYFEVCLVGIYEIQVKMTGHGR